MPSLTLLRAHAHPIAPTADKRRVQARTKTLTAGNRTRTLTSGRPRLQPRPRAARKRQAARSTNRLGRGIRAWNQGIRDHVPRFAGSRQPRQGTGGRQGTTHSAAPPSSSCSKRRQASHAKPHSNDRRGRQQACSTSCSHCRPKEPPRRQGPHCHHARSQGSQQPHQRRRMHRKQPNKRPGSAARAARAAISHASTAAHTQASGEAGHAVCNTRLEQPSGHSS